MDNEIVVLRTLHIIPGVFWAGGATFVAFVLEPSLRRLGDDVQHSVMRSVNRVMSPAVTGAAVLTVIFGLILIARIPDHGFDELFVDGWGWSIGLGLIASILALLAGALGGMSSAQLYRLLDRIEGGRGAPQETAEVQRLMARVRTIGQIHALLTLVAVAAMAGARWI